MGQPPGNLLVTLEPSARAAGTGGRPDRPATAVTLRTLAAGLALVGCSSGAVLQGAPRELVMKTARECESEFAGVRVKGVDRYGRVEFTYQTEPQRDGFSACVQDRSRQRIENAMQEIAAGHLVPSPDGSRETSIPIQIRGSLMLLPVMANGRERLTLLLDTGASKTILRPSVAARLGIAPPADAPRWPSQLADGRVIVIPYTRLHSIALGDLVIEDLDVGVYELLRDSGPVDGILGGDLLGHFRMTVDRKAERLELAVR
jgi:predicted aspartyl protease